MALHFSIMTLPLFSSILIFTSVKEDVKIVIIVCLLATLRKNFQTDLREIYREVWQWANEQMIKIWWRFGSPFQIRHYWEIWKVVINGHKSAGHTDLPDGGTGKTCLGGGMHCPSASNFIFEERYPRFFAVERVQIHNRFTTTSPNRSTAILGVWSTSTTLALSLLICENLNWSHCGFVCESGPLNPMAAYLDPSTPWLATCLLQRLRSIVTMLPTTLLQLKSIGCRALR